mgnify:CR=1 FL=1
MIIWYTLNVDEIILKKIYNDFLKLYVSMYFSSMY